MHDLVLNDAASKIIAADSSHLGLAHLENVGITQDIPIAIYGIENTGEFPKIRDNPAAILNVKKMTEELVGVASTLTRNHPEIGAIVPECTDLPPFAAAIRRETGLPVFDIATMVHRVMESIAGDRWKTS